MYGRRKQDHLQVLWHKCAHGRSYSVDTLGRRSRRDHLLELSRKPSMQNSRFGSIRLRHPGKVFGRLDGRLLARACLAIMRVAAGLRPHQGAAWIAGFLSCFVELAWQYHTNITVPSTTPVVPAIVLACFIVMMVVVWPKAHCRKCSGGEDKQASRLAVATMV